MKLYIGIDLGTSAMKLLLMSADGTIHNTVTKEYPLEFPQPGWSQQNPEDWKKALFEGLPELLNGFDASQVASIGAKIRSGETSLEELAAYAEAMGAPALPGSGRQEYLESIVNNVLFCG